MNNPVLLIIGILLGVLCVSFLIYKCVMFTKQGKLGGEEIKIDNKLKRILIVLILIQGLFTIMSSYGVVIFNGWKLNAGEHVCVIFGSYLFGSGFSALISSFILYYYRRDLFVNQRKFIFKVMIISIPIFIVGIYLLTQGLADSLTYPIANSISFKTGFGYPDGKDYGFTIAFYGIVIVFGALVAYFIADHYMYNKFGKHGILETCALIAVPMGIIGARLWYCLVLETETYVKNPAAIFNIRDGGLAIQGGAILGILTGILFLLKFRKYVDIRFVLDVCAPCILIAQAIGRWGNFFNCEVHGNQVSEIYWQWLPKILFNNIHYSSVTHSFASEGMVFLPLCFIEMFFTLGGYFLIRYAIAKPLHKVLPLGSQAGLYIFWYGVTRAVLEPLREGFTLDVGSSKAFGYMQSWITAFVMIGVGLIVIGICFIWNYVIYKKKNIWLTFENIHTEAVDKCLEQKS